MIEIVTELIVSDVQYGMVESQCHAQYICLAAHQCLLSRIECLRICEDGIRADRYACGVDSPHLHPDNIRANNHTN